MFDSGHVFRRVFSRLPSPFASQSDAAIGAPRQFGSTEHLSTEAIAAYVDGELRMTAHMRAGTHLSLCAQCAAEVEAQKQARTALRQSCPIDIPSTLLTMLSKIPNAPTTPPDDVIGQQDSTADPLADRPATDRRKRR